jgi:hypothetical protein
MKLGGLNYVLSKDDIYVKIFMSDDVLFMSYDVSKPPPLSNAQRRNGLTDSEPSCVGVRDRCMRARMYTRVQMAATTCREKMLATIDFLLQPGRHEEVVGLETLTATMLARYERTHNGRLPYRYVVYRDGVSEGEYAMCLSNELPRIRAAIDKRAQELNMINFKVGCVGA